MADAHCSILFQHVMKEKCCLKVTVCIKQQAIFLQQNYHVWKDAMHPSIKLGLPLIFLLRHI